jgi:hypothetical protein
MIPVGTPGLGVRQPDGVFLKPSRKYPKTFKEMTQNLQGNAPLSI